MKRLLSLVFCTLLMAVIAPLSAAPHAQGQVRVKITTVEMSRNDVERLSLTTPPLTRRHEDLQSLINAAHRIHASFVRANGPTITTTTGRPVTANGVTVTPLSVRHGRAYVRVGVIRADSTQSRRSQPTHIITDNHLYRNGETRRLAGARLSNNRYRYTFASVSIL